MWLCERQPLSLCALLAARKGVCTHPYNHALIYSLGFLHHHSLGAAISSPQRWHWGHVATWVQGDTSPK